LHRTRNVWETYYQDSPSSASPVATDSNTLPTNLASPSDFFLQGFPVITENDDDDEFERQVFYIIALETYFFTFN